ncbi:MAG TPA: DNRLRE domain-containing protein [Vicinamibacterales bacterium]|jgi:hypothetical protein
MGWGVSLPGRRASARIGLVALLTASAIGHDISAQSSQTTIVLSAPDSQVLDTYIRNGPYANSNLDGSVLLTRWSTVPEWERRSIFRIDTSTIPIGSPVSSAVLTLTVRSGLGTAGSTRPVSAYRMTQPFVEREATWNSRWSGNPWDTPGGDLAESVSTVNVTNTVGAKINFDVTSLVQRAVNGEFGLRYTRIALIDVGGGGDVKESYREYHSSEAASTDDRPQLRVVYGSITDPSTTPIDVPAGGSLQAALNQVASGGTIRLAPGAVYSGNFVLPAKSGTNYVLITTNTSLPAPGTRITQSYRGQLATIRSIDGFPALSTATSAGYYRIVGVNFEANVGGTGDVIALGTSDQTTVAAAAHHIELDRVIINGDPSVGQKRGVSVNAAHVTIINSDIRGIKAAGQDSQGIAGWNTPGPITIRNNRIEAAGENIMFGGANATIPNVVPSDIVVENNHLTKDLAWRGTSWSVKNIFELKNARRVLVRNNLLEYNWQAAQVGFAVVLTPRNSGSQNPWAVVEDVEFSGNVLRHSGSAFNMSGHDDTAISGQLARILIKDNLVYDISSANWGGGGIFAQIGGEPRDITFDHNTVMHTGNIMSLYSGVYYNSSGVRVTSGPILGLVFTNNMMKHNAYGIFGSGRSYGNDSLNYYAPGAVVRRNVIAKDASPASRYPPDNFFPTVAAFLASFNNIPANDYTLVPGSPYIGAGTDGRNLGCSLSSSAGGC